MKTMSPEAAAAYVAHCLRLNPIWEAEEILLARARAHDLESARESSRQRAMKQAQLRAEVREKVYALRDNAWTSAPDETLRELSALTLDEQPELHPIARRVATVAESIPTLHQLSQHRHYDAEFLEGLKQVLTSSPQQSALVREKMAATMQDKRLRKRYRRMIKLLEREAPELCGLESDWLRSLRKGRLRLTLSSRRRRSRR